MKTFINESRKLLNSLPACEGDMARLAHRLSRACNKLESMLEQANAQFKAGDHAGATFSKQAIALIESEEND